MASPNTNILLPLIATITIFLTLLCKVKSYDNFTHFEFTSFDPTQAHKLIFQGDANISSKNTLQLTKTFDNNNPQRNNVGRVFYSDPVHIWERSTGKVSSFETTFTFVITSPTREIIGDGITFFFAPVDSTIPPHSDGGFFGLFSNNTFGQSVDVKNSPYHILAVEFDTYVDSRWDPNYLHIGIDVNTVSSRAEIKWDRKSGDVLTTTISYNTNNKKLYVSSSYPNGAEYEFSSSIELHAVLPEHVRVGFSASTGDSAVETHDILSWSFSAWLHDVNYPLATEEDRNINTPLYYTY